MDGFLIPSTCTNEDLILIYAHADCAAFADILQWNFESEGLDSTVVMAGNRLQNHFYVKIKIKNEKTLYCDAYGIYENDADILERYNFINEDVTEIENHEDDKLIKTLIDSSFAYQELEDNENKEEEFFLKMQDVFSEWKRTLKDNKVLDIK